MSAAHRIGNRTLLAMTCVICGRLRSGQEFERYQRKATDKHLYFTRRCRPCRWRRLEDHRYGAAQESRSSRGG